LQAVGQEFDPPHLHHNMNKVFTINSGRSCNGCTACCEGWLTGVAYGYAFSPGVKCKFLCADGCGIYTARPYNPCKTFQCHWKINTRVPEWMQPNRSGVIILQKYYEPFHFLRLVKTGRRLDPRVYEWAKEHAKAGANIVSFEESEPLIFSENQEFIELMKKELSN